MSALLSRNINTQCELPLGRPDFFSTLQPNVKKQENTLSGFGTQGEKTLTHHTLTLLGT